MQLKGEWNPGSGAKKDTFHGSMHRLVHMCVLSHAQVFATPWTAARQAPLSMGFSRQESWSGLPSPPPGNLPNLGIKPSSPLSPALAGRSLDLEPNAVLCLSYSLEAPLSLEVCPNIKAFQHLKKREICHGVGFPGGTGGKEPATECRRRKRRKFEPWVGKSPWRRARRPTAVSLPGEPHGQRSPAATVHRVPESDTTERLSTARHPLFVSRLIHLRYELHKLYLRPH